MYNITLIMIGHLAYFLVALAYFLKDVLYLRIFSILSSIFGIIYFAFYAEHPLWVNIFWCILFIVINLGHVYLLIRDKYYVFKNKEEKYLFENVFNILTPGEFKKLLKIAAYAKFEKDETIIQAGEKVESIMVVITGQATITVDDKIISRIGPGNFIGEMSFISGNPAAATVRAETELKCYKWAHSQLRDFLNKNTHTENSLRAIFNTQLVKRLSSNNKALFVE